MKCSSPIFALVLRLERLPSLVRRKVAMLRAFTDGFWKVYELSFTSRDSARFDWHSFEQLLVWRFLLWLSMKRRQRYLVRFLESIWVVFYFSWLCPVWLTLFWAVVSLKVPAMIIYEKATKVFGTEEFPLYIVAVYCHLFCSVRSLFGEKK